MRNVVVLGATSDIAKAVSQYFASKETNLIIAGRNEEELSLLAEDMKIRHGVSVFPKYFEALDYSSHQQFFDECVSECGRLDGVFLAYGFMAEQKEAEADFDLAKRMIDTNYTSAVSILEIAAKYFERERRGFICAVSSVAGDRGRQNNYLYGSSKGALTVFLQGLRNRLSKSGVDVITIKPGFVDTKMTFGTLGDSPLVVQPESVAKSIYKAIKKKKSVAYTPLFWVFIMLVIKLIPEKIFKKLNL